jgi:hypothetical protein
LPSSLAPFSAICGSFHTQKSMWPRPAPVWLSSCTLGAGPSHATFDLPAASLPVTTRLIGVTAMSCVSCPELRF